MERVKRKILAEHRSLSKTRKKITDFAVNFNKTTIWVFEVFLKVSQIDIVILEKNLLSKST